MCRGTKPISSMKGRIDLNGMKRLPVLLAEVLNSPSKSAQNDLSRRLEYVG
jgi:hypothetical protein